MGLKYLGVTVLILFIIICNVPNSLATEANVVIDIEYSNIQYNFKTNDTRLLILNATVSCNIDGFGQNVQYVDVEVTVYDQRVWLEASVLKYRFTENGTENFKIELTIPIDVENRTLNKVIGTSEWLAETHYGSLYKNGGSGKSDVCNITIYRPEYSSAVGSVIMNTDFQHNGWFEASFPCIIGLICIIVPVIIVIVYFFRKRNQEMKL